MVMNRARYRHNLKPGSINLSLKQGATVLNLTDDSVTSSGSATTTNIGRQYNLVSGSSGVMLGSSIAQIGTTSSYGFVYPDAGLIVINPDALGLKLTNTAPTKVANSNGNNTNKLLTVMEAGDTFISDSEERITSQYYFTRVKNFEFNYSSNPSFIDNQGNLNFTSMIDMPKVYISTVGLYNDDGDLLAVAKISQPIAKDFTKEALIRVKLDY